jgi:hypothetical protein
MWESVEADRSFHVLCRRVESNDRILDDAVTTARKPPDFAAINRLKQKAKGCPAGRIAHAHNIVGLAGVRIELKGRGNAQKQ